MVECESLLKCAIVNDTAAERVFIEKVKREYCTGNFQACARFMVLKSVGGDFVSNDLLPDQEERAKEIIEEAKEWL